MNDYILGPWRRGLDFKGRSTRREYWLFQLQMPVIAVLGIIIYGIVGENWLSNILLGLLMLGLLPWFVVSIAIGVRRLHDHDKSGWWLLIGLLPYLGGLIQFILMLIPGDAGENSYGYDPREGGQPAGEVARIFS